MVNLSNPFTEEHEAFRRTVRAYVEKELAPHALEWDRAGSFPREVFKQCGELGFFGINYAPEWGGSGLDYWYVTVFAEELSRSLNGGVNTALLVQSQMATPVIASLGTEEQKREFLVPALAGERIAALAVSEPGAGSDVASLRTSARREGEEYVINGSKMWITNGARADFLTLAVRTGGEGHEGISLVTFPTDTQGFSVSKKLDKVGQLASDTAILYFEDCRLPARYVLGEEDQGFYYIMMNFQGERLVAALQAVAAMERMIEQALEYGSQREVFGRPLLKYQVWRHKLVEHMTAIEAARRLTYHAVDLFNRDEPAQREITMAKLFAGDLAQRVAYDVQQLFGGMGYIEETPIARAWRDIRLITIGGGTSEIMKEILVKLSGL